MMESDLPRDPEPSADSVHGNFHHPYTPYDVQVQFMRVAYDVLSRGDGQVGILESPTGTVRDLSPVHHGICFIPVCS